VQTRLHRAEADFGDARDLFQKKNLREMEQQNGAHEFPAID